MECKKSVLAGPASHMHTSSRQRRSRWYSYRKSPAMQLTGCHVVSELLGILAAGAIPNRLRIAGALQIPRSTAPLMEVAGAPPIGRYAARNTVKASLIENESRKSFPVCGCAKATDLSQSAAAREQKTDKKSRSEAESLRAANSGQKSNPRGINICL